MSVRRALRVRGRVQGVGFRWATQREARALGLRGWVRNAPDGSVEIEVEGHEAAVGRLVTWARLGPSGARVDSLDLLVPSDRQLAGDFEITF